MLRRRCAPRRPSRAFTILELIIALAILAVVTALVIPTYTTIENYTKDNVAAAELGALAREATAVAVSTRNDGTITAADFTTAVGDRPTLTTAGAGLSAAATPLTLVSTFSNAFGTVSLGYGPGSLVAGVAMQTTPTHCAMARAAFGGTGVQYWAVHTYLGANCSGTQALSGPAASYSAPPPVATPTNVVAVRGDSAPSTGSATVSWDAQPSATSYTVTASPTPTSGPASQTVSGTSATFTSLPALQAVTFSVTATDGVTTTPAATSTPLTIYAESSSVQTNFVVFDAAGDRFDVGKVLSGQSQLDRAGRHLVLPTSADAGVFVVKSDPSGTPVAAAVFSGPLTVGGADVTPAGTLYIGGGLNGSATLGGHTITSASGTNPYLLVLDSSLAVLSATRYTGASGDQFQAVGAAPDGSAYVSGNVGSATPLQLGGFSVDATAPAGSGYLAHVDAAGAVSAVWHVGQNATLAGQALRVDGSGNVVWAAQTSSGSVTFGSTTGTSASPIGVVAKYDPAGAQQWATLLPVTAQTVPQRLALDTGGNVYVAGTSPAPFSWGSSTVSWSGGQPAGFVGKLSSAGTLVWAVGATPDAVSSGQAQAVTVDAAGTVYAGFTGGQPCGGCAGQLTVGGTAYPTSGGFDVVLAKISTAGAVLSAKQVSTARSDFAQGAGVDPGGHAVFGLTYGSGATLNGKALPMNTSWLDSWTISYDF